MHQNQEKWRQVCVRAVSMNACQSKCANERDSGTYCCDSSMRESCDALMHFKRDLVFVRSVQEIHYLLEK